MSGHTRAPKKQPVVARFLRIIAAFLQGPEAIIDDDRAAEEYERTLQRSLYIRDSSRRSATLENEAITAGLTYKRTKRDQKISEQFEISK